MELGNGQVEGILACCIARTIMAAPLGVVFVSVSSFQGGHDEAR